MPSTTMRITGFLTFLLGGFSGLLWPAIRPLAEVPFEVYDNRIILKGVTVNGQGGWLFVFDSGAGESGVVAAETTRLGLKTDQEEEVMAPGGLMRMPFSRGCSLGFGEVLLRGLRLCHLQIPPAVTRNGEKTVGIVGYDLLSRYVVALDFDLGVMRLYEATTYRYDGPGEPVALRLRGKTPGIRLSLALPDGATVEDEFGLDLGMPGALLLDAAFARKHALREQPSGSAAKSVGGVGGAPTQVSEATLPSVKVGGATLADVSALLLEKDPPIFANDQRAGLVGLAAMKRFNLVFDYSRKQLHLEKNRAFAQPTGEKAPLKPEPASGPWAKAAEAARTGDATLLADCLAQDGALLKMTNPAGWTLLHVAAFNDQAPTARLLVEKGAELNAQDGKNGATPLHLAVYRGSRDMVELLVKHGADLTLQDKRGLTPAAMAQVTGKLELAGLLKP